MRDAGGRSGSGRRPSGRRLGILLALLAAAGGIWLWTRAREWQARRMPLDQLVEAARRTDAHHAHVALAVERLLAAGRPADARNLLELRIESLGAESRWHTLLGRACLESGATKEAYARLKVALMLDPGSGEAHWWLAETLRQQGRPDEAGQEFRAAMRAGPRAGEAALRLGAEALESNQYGHALELLDRAEERLASGETARLRARALWKMGRLEEAAKAARAAVEREPTAASDLLLGQLLAASFDLARRREGLTYLRRAAEQDPGSEEAHRELGLLHRLLGELRPAVRELRAALRLNPGAVALYVPLAQTYGALGDVRRAAAVRRIYARLEPLEIRMAQAEYRASASQGSPESRLALARVYADCGLQDRARRELESLLQSHPEFQLARRLLARLPARRSLVIPDLPTDPGSSS